MPREWNASAYDRVSGPQVSWGLKVLDRLPLQGDERAIDAGCGTGRLTAELLSRLPDGRVIAVDRSWNMLLTARANLRPAFDTRVAFVQVALPSMPFRGWADLVFSTATFHWVTDHEALFTAIHDALRPGGRLFAQCGGGPNLAGAHALARQLMKREPFARYFAEWAGPWHFATPGDTARRLIAAGFTEVSSDLEPAPTTLADESSYREFVATVIYHSHLERLPDGGLRAQWLDDITVLAAQQDPPFTLDYWRLNLAGRRPR